MKARFVFFITVFTCAILGLGFAGDEDPLKQFLARLEKYRTNYGQEKIHIHTDKPYYTIGDTIWFKSYIVLAENHQLSALSKIVYVELLNERDSIKKSLRLPVRSGLAWGDFVLSDTLTEGNYRIRAYTNWMRNFDEAYFFDKNIKIGNSFSSQIVSSINYKFSKTGVKENVNAEINYKKLNGAPLSGREVSYDIQLDHRNILKGKGITDSTGKLNIQFTNAQPFILKSGQIFTTIKIDDKTSARKSFPVKSTSSEVDIQFFPESGELVNDVRSRVAVKAVSSDGLGKNVSGEVLDDNGNKIAEFKTEHAGMGSFVFTPLRNKFYSALVRFEDGSEKKYSIPRATEGYVLSISSNPNDLIVKVFAGKNYKANEELLIVGQLNGVPYFMSKKKLEDNFISGSIPKKRFPTGIVQFTLFNKSFQPLAERLVFVRNSPTLNLSVSTSEHTYKAKEKVKMEFAATDSSSKPVLGTFSLAVTDESQVPYDDVNETTILSNLLLSSELKGFIEKPNFYFTDPGPEKDRALDNLLLSQGWRRFEWSKINRGLFPYVVFAPETGITISGRLLAPRSGKPVPNGKVTLLSSGGTGMVLDTLSDAAGRFRFSNLQFNDSTSFTIRGWNESNRPNVDIEVDRNPRQIVTKNPNAPALEPNVNQSLMTYIAKRNEEFEEMRKKGMFRKSIVLAEVKVVDKKPKVKNSANLNGPGNADGILVASDLNMCQTLEFCIQGRFAGVIIQNGIPYLTRNLYSSYQNPPPMLLVVDGSYLDGSYLNSINPREVESIEILKNIENITIYGIRGGGGVMIITTRVGERRISPGLYAQGMASFTPQGYTMSRKFYSPKYDTPASQAVQDWRTTIFWEPNLLTGPDGKASVEFYTSSKPGTYKAVIEGVDLNGSIVRQVHRFNVK